MPKSCLLKWTRKLVLTSLILSTTVFAAVPEKISYQGKLADGAGLALNGNYSLTFNIYDVAVVACRCGRNPESCGR